MNLLSAGVEIHRHINELSLLLYEATPQHSLKHDSLRCHLVAESTPTLFVNVVFQSSVTSIQVIKSQNSKPSFGFVITSFIYWISVLFKDIQPVKTLEFTCFGPRTYRLIKSHKMFVGHVRFW